MKANGVMTCNMGKVKKLGMIQVASLKVNSLMACVKVMVSGRLIKILDKKFIKAFGKTT